MIVALAGMGVEDIVLVDGDCTTCKYGAVSAAVDETVESAVRLFEMIGASAIVTRCSMIVALAGMGVEDIVLVDGDCTTCKYGAVSAAVDETVESAVRLFEMIGASAIVTRCSEFPREVLAEDERKVIGAARRGFFSQASGIARNVAVTAAENGGKGHRRRAPSEQAAQASHSARAARGGEKREAADLSAGAQPLSPR